MRGRSDLPTPGDRDAWVARHAGVGSPCQRSIGSLARRATPREPRRLPWRAAVPSPYSTGSRCRSGATCGARRIRLASRLESGPSGEGRGGRCRPAVRAARAPSAAVSRDAARRGASPRACRGCSSGPSVLRGRRQHARLAAQVVHVVGRGGVADPCGRTAAGASFSSGRSPGARIDLQRADERRPGHPPAPRSAAGARSFASVRGAARRVVSRPAGRRGGCARPAGAREPRWGP